MSNEFILANFNDIHPVILEMEEELSELLVIDGCIKRFVQSPLSGNRIALL